MSSRIFPLALLGVLSLAVFVRAALPPGSYDKLRADATDAVTIQVSSVTEVPNGQTRNVTVEAKVLSVERSKSGLKKGDAVTITYSIFAAPIVGPSPIPVLEKDEVYPAFLNRKDKTFVPAAYGSSFRMTPEPFRP